MGFKMLLGPLALLTAWSWRLLEGYVCYVCIAWHSLGRLDRPFKGAEDFMAGLACKGSGDFNVQPG